MNDRTPARRRQRVLRQLAALSCLQWVDLARAAFELAIARLRIRAAGIKEILARQEAPEHPGDAPAAADVLMIDRVKLAIPRAAAGVPWRSDCLIQALAAQRWLAGQGVRSNICIGVRKDPAGPLVAHAWLESADRIITGGDIKDFDLIFDQTETLDRLNFE